MARTLALPILSAERDLTRYFEEIRRFPMLESKEEYTLAKRWREQGDRAAAHKLVTSHLRLVAKIATGYRGYGLPISEVISEGNVGLMQAVKRFEPEKGFRLATYAMWWIRAAIQEYVLRSWSLVKMGTTPSQKKVFFNLRKAKSKIFALNQGDMRPDQVALIAKRIGVAEQEVVDMNRRLSGDVSLNAPITDDGEPGEWQDWLVDESDSQEMVIAEQEEFDYRKKALIEALSVLNVRERRIFEMRRMAENPITLAELAGEFDVSRERVRQIEVSAFEKVQAAVKSSVAMIESPLSAVGARLCVVPILLAASITVGASGLALVTIGLTFARAETAIGTIGQPQALKQSQDTLSSYIAYFKAVLRMTAVQERHWPPVESALRRIAQHKVDQVGDGGINLRIGDGATEFTLSIAELGRFILAAQPLINSLDQAQKHDAFMLAQTMGLGSVAEKFK